MTANQKKDFELIARSISKLKQKRLKPLIGDTKELIDRMYRMGPLVPYDKGLAGFLETWAEILILLNGRAKQAMFRSVWDGKGKKAKRRWWECQYCEARFPSDSPAECPYCDEDGSKEIHPTRKQEKLLLGDDEYGFNIKPIDWEEAGDDKR